MKLCQLSRFFLLILVMFVLQSSSHAQKRDNLLLKDIEGVWYINLTNFPLWLKGDKTNPRFNYTVLSPTKVKDELTYQKKGKTKTVVGIDKVNPDERMAFVWRGKGVLFFTRSKWKILYYNKKYSIALLAFEKTLFTPAGYDIISREKNLPIGALQLIRQELRAINPNVELTVVAQE